MSPLNPVLHKRLLEVFGKVHIVNPGQQTAVKYLPDWIYRKGRLKAEGGGGEEYKVCCCFCNDTGFHLYINHRWGVRDPRTRDDFLHLCHCFKEQCLGTREKQKQLHAKVFPDSRYADQVELPVTPVMTKPPAPPPVIQLPVSTPLTKLPDGHPALRYLARRGFSAKPFAASRGLRYCEKDENAHPAILEPRLIIPIDVLMRLPSAVLGGDKGPVDTRLAGWQARLLGIPKTKRTPKYLTSAGMKKSQMLYGLAAAVRASGPVVLVEGVVDAWKVGSTGLALFGKTISNDQCELIARELKGRPIVVLLDDDASKEAKAIVVAVARARRLARDSAPVLAATVPENRHDPGECSTAELRKVISLAIHGH